MLHSHNVWGELYLWGEFMGLNAGEAQHDNPGSQEDEAEQPRCDIEGGHNARGQVELVHNEAEDGSNDGPRAQRPELQSSQNELIQKHIK